MLNNKPVVVGFVWLIITLSVNREITIMDLIARIIRNLVDVAQYRARDLGGQPGTSVMYELQLVLPDPPRGLHQIMKPYLSLVPGCLERLYIHPFYLVCLDPRLSQMSIQVYHAVPYWQPYRSRQALLRQYRILARRPCRRHP